MWRRSSSSMFILLNYCHHYHIYRFQGFGCGFLKDSENERVKANPNATNSYRMAKILLKLGCGRNFIYLPDNKKDNTYRNCNHETELFLWPFGDTAT